MMFSSDLLIVFFSFNLVIISVNGLTDSNLINLDAIIPCFKIRCYSQNLGCFKPLISGLIILFPPISVCPETPSIVNLTFRVANQENPAMFLESPSTRHPYSRLTPGRSLAFYSHGCFGSYADKFSLFTGLGLLRDYYQVVLSDWVRGANPPIILKQPAIINLFLCTANCEIVGRKVANAYNFAVTRLGINPENITVVGHSAGSASTHFTAVWLQERYKMTPYETIALDVVSDPYQPSTVFGVSKLDAIYNTAVHTTYNFPVPIVSHVPAALDLKVGSPFALSHTDLFVNAPFGLLVKQPPCGLLPFCSHFYAIIVYMASLFGCEFEPCSSSFLFPGQSSGPTGVASSVYGRRGTLCISVSAYPLTECKCNQTKGGNLRKHRFLN